MVEIEFTGSVVEWRGPAPYLFVTIPESCIGDIRFGARIASYGWGVVPVAATIGATPFTTSLFPRDGGYLLPVKLAVQRAEGIGLGSTVTVRIVIAAR